jgi:hypothetical protein
MDDHDCDCIADNYDREVLYELPAIIVSPAPEHPHFVQHEMAADRSKVCN